MHHPDDESGPAPARAPDGKFLRGNSGNPHGRKKGSGGPGPVSPQLRRRVDIEIGGKKRRLNIVDAALRKLGDRAVEGDPAATRELMRIAREQRAAAAAEAEILAKGAPLKKHNTYGFPYFGPEVLERALLDLDILVEDHGRLFLRRWAIEAARARMSEDEQRAKWRAGGGVDEHCI